MSLSRRTRFAIAMVAALGALIAVTPVLAQESAEPDSASSSPKAAIDAAKADGREFLVPEMQGRGFHLEPGPRPYLHRLGFSPAFGNLGRDPYYAFRLSYNPSQWIGYEAHIGHNPAESVHALVHALNVVVRWPLPWRLQPYASAGYGMMMVFPGRVFEADPVTKNQLGVGAGLEFYLRDDIALRGEIRGTSVIGNPPDGQSTEVYEYREVTLGMTFFRTLNP